MIFYVLVTLSFSLLPLLLPLIVIVVHNFHDHHIHFHNSIQEYRNILKKKLFFLSDIVDISSSFFSYPLCPPSPLCPPPRCPPPLCCPHCPGCPPKVVLVQICLQNNINNHCILHAIHPHLRRPSPGNVRYYAREIHFDQKQQIQPPNSMAKL